MYNLLLVDDEVSVVNGLMYDIEWSDINITGVYKAHSVTQAMNLLEQLRIDIVVTDICMPEADGIQLTEMIKSKWPFAVVILLSGFDDFEYAQKAIELGVFSYVTKPVVYEEFKNIIQKAVLKLEEELCKEKILQSARISIENIRPIMQERYLNAWIIKGRENPAVNLEKPAACGLEINMKESVFLTVIRVDESSIMDNTEEGVLELALKELSFEWLLKGKKAIFFKDEKGKFILLYKGLEQQDCIQRLKYMEEVAEPFKESVRRTLGCIISIFFGEVIEMNGIREAYRKLETLVSRMVSNTSGVIMLPGKSSIDNSYSRLDVLYESPELSMIVDSLDTSKAVDRINRIFEEVGKKKSIDRIYLLEVFNYISDVIIQASLRNGFGISQWAGEEERILYNFELVNKVVDLKSWCIRIIKRFIDYTVSIEKKQSHHIIEHAKKIVEENCLKDISVVEIASYLYLHPNYLTRLFKAQTGLSLMHYISKRRMAHAKELLAQPGFKVYEVAQRIGYESIAHFNMIFKREFGMTPKEYQKIADKEV